MLILQYGRKRTNDKDVDALILQYGRKRTNEEDVDVLILQYGRKRMNGIVNLKDVDVTLTLTLRKCTTSSNKVKCCR